jgi:predicted nucleic acid-binding protein
LRRILVDTGAWYTLFEKRSIDDWSPSQRRRAQKTVDESALIVPWPTLYEAVGTRLAKNAEAMARVNSIIKRPGVTLLDDRPYRERALTECLRLAAKRQPLSLVDRCLQLILEDHRVRVSGLLTTDRSDFADIAVRLGIELLPDP